MRQGSDWSSEACSTEKASSKHPAAPANERWYHSCPRAPHLSRICSSRIMLSRTSSGMSSSPVAEDGATAAGGCRAAPPAAEEGGAAVAAAPRPARPSRQGSVRARAGGEEAYCAAHGDIARALARGRLNWTTPRVAATLLPTWSADSGHCHYTLLSRLAKVSRLSLC